MRTLQWLWYSIFTSACDAFVSYSFHPFRFTITTSTSFTTTGTDFISSTAFRGHEPSSPCISIDLGPPDALKDLRMEDEPLHAFRRTTTRIQNTTTMQIPIPETVIHNFTIHRLAHDPDIFLLQNYLTTYECHEVYKHVQEQTIMTPAETVTANDYQSRTFCQVSWIPSSGPQKSNVVSNIMASTAHLLLSKSILHHPSAGVEDLQVLKYTTGGEFVLHHDGEPRILTVIYYLNGVAGTWFPLAQTKNERDTTTTTTTETDDWDVEQQFQQTRRDPWNKQQALDFGKDFVPGKNGVLVRSSTGLPSKTNSDNFENPRDEHVVMVEPGDAIAFYNYRNDNTGRLNWRALHTGLPTNATEKWIANHWFRVNDLLELQ